MYKNKMGILISWLSFIFHQFHSNIKIKFNLINITTKQVKRMRQKFELWFKKCGSLTRASDCEGRVEFWNGKNLAFGCKTSETETVWREWNWKSSHFYFFSIFGSFSVPVIRHVSYPLIVLVGRYEISFRRDMTRRIVDWSCLDTAGQIFFFFYNNTY